MNLRVLARPLGPGAASCPCSSQGWEHIFRALPKKLLAPGAGVGGGLHLWERHTGSGRTVARSGTPLLGDAVAGDEERAAWSQVAPDGQRVLEWHLQPCVARPFRDGLLLEKSRFLTLYLSLGDAKLCL